MPDRFDPQRATNGVELACGSSPRAKRVPLPEAGPHSVYVRHRMSGPICGVRSSKQKENASPPTVHATPSLVPAAALDGPFSTMMLVQINVAIAVRNQGIGAGRKRSALLSHLAVPAGPPHQHAAWCGLNCTLVCAKR